jgi:predicted TPR repeat methyltransferase
MNSSIRMHDEYAAEYDLYTESQWGGPDVMFKMSFGYMKSHHKVLDVGIGTGLGALPFADQGMDIFGIDGSKKMLEICEAKGFAKELRHLDLQKTPLPYDDAFFNHVISCGVFHFLDNLGPLFQEVARIMKPEGIFAFVLMVDKEKKNDASSPEDFSTLESEGVTMYMYHENFIDSLLQKNGFEKLKTQKFIVQNGPDGDDLLFSSYVSRKLQR